MCILERFFKKKDTFVVAKSGPTFLVSLVDICQLNFEALLSLVEFRIFVYLS